MQIVIKIAEVIGRYTFVESHKTSNITCVFINVALLFVNVASAPVTSRGRCWVTYGAPVRFM